MRFLVRLTLLGVLFLIFLLLILIQQKSIIIKNKLLSSNKATFLKENIFNNKSKINNNNNNFLIFIRPKVNLNEPTEEDKEARRLLQLSGSTSDDGIPVPVGQQPNNINNGGNYPQLETVVGSGLLFPIGRYPSGNIRGNVIKGQLTLNVAVVLVVSLLSIAVLITAICCVIIIALAMDSTNNITTINDENNSSNFISSNWPTNLMLPQIDIETGNSLTDDEIEEEEENKIKINNQKQQNCNINCDLELLLIEKEIK